MAFAPDQVDDMQHQLLVVRLAITFLRESRVGVVLLEAEALGRERKHWKGRGACHARLSPSLQVRNAKKS